MTKYFTATLAAAAVALAGFTAAPARADGKDVAKVLAGIAALYIIGKAIDDRKDRRVAPAPQPVRRALPLSCVRTVQTRKGEVQMLGQRCINRRVGHVNLPNRCERQIRRYDGGHRTMFKRSCLERHGYRIVARR